MVSVAESVGELPPPRRVGIVGLDLETGNPYLDRLAAALRHAGADVEPLRLRPLDVARAWRRGVRVAHVQWPEYLIWPSARGDLLGRAREAIALARLTTALVLCRLLGVRVVWTVHNLAPHDRRAPWFAPLAYRIVGALAESYVTHSNDAARRTAERYPRAEGRTIVAPHGDYGGLYAAPPPGGGGAVRARHGISPNAVVLLAFGQVRSYKRLDELARLVGQLGDGVHLLIVGAPVDDDHAAAVQAAAANAPRVHLELRRVDDREVSAFYAAADLVVLHYVEVFSSGALLLALTQGVTVLAPQSAAAEEVARPPALFTYEGDNLGSAVIRALATPPGARCTAALEAARAASWDRAAERVLEAYDA